MRDAGIGRLVVASLHQAIAELLPMRLGFYEGWLSAEGFRDGHLDLAGLYAVFSFLRTEGALYDTIVRRAGTCAAQWYLASQPRTTRAFARRMPSWLRIRWCCRLARRMALQTYKQTRVTARWRAGVGRFVIRRSLFCEVRGPVDGPLCGYYSAIIEELLQEFSTPAGVRIAQCRARGGDVCTIEVTSTAARTDRRLVGVWLLPLLLSVAASGAAQTVPARTAPLAPPALDQSKRPETATGLILVMPFEIEGRDARLHWLTEAASVLLTESLEFQGAMVIPRDERLRAFERLQVPPLATISRATVIRVGQLVGAAAVVTGSIRPVGNTLQVNARCIHLSTGRMDAELSEQGAVSEIFGVFDRVALGLQPPATPGSQARQGRPRPPLPAFEAYVKGLIAETPAAQLTNLKTALVLMPGFDDARLAAWKAYTASGDHRGALKVLDPVAEGSASFAAARFFAANSQIALKQYADALTTLTALLKRAPAASVLNNIGVVQQRLSAEAAESGGRPTWYFNQARELDPQDPDYVFNLGYAYWTEHDAGAATYWLKEAVRLNPADAAAHAVLSQALRASGAASEAVRELELAQQLSSAYRGAHEATLRFGPGAARTGAAEGSPWSAARAGRGIDDRRRRAAGAGRTRHDLPGSWPEAGRAGAGSRGGLRTGPGALSVALPRRGPPAARSGLHAYRAPSRSHRRAEDLAVERGNPCGAPGACRGLPCGEERGRRPNRSPARARDGSGLDRGQTPARSTRAAARRLASDIIASVLSRRLVDPPRGTGTPAGSRAPVMLWTRRSAYRVSISAIILAAALCTLETGFDASEPAPVAGPAPVVLVAEVDALIQPVSADYMVKTIDRADREGAALLVFILRTPGGLVDSTREIITRMLAASTPVAVFVAPSGSHAASAGFLVILASDLAVMAPGTHIGAAHPVSGEGEKMDETMAKKVASDVAAYARTLAGKRGRNVDLAEQAVRESRSFTEEEALKATPPIIDLVAADVPDLLNKCNLREVKRFDGRVVTLHTAGARLEYVEMTLRQQVLSAIAHPNVAYILMSLGVLGLTIELWSPGAILPGVAGGICLLLAFFAFQVLPVNYAGVLLIVFGLGLLVLEIKVTSYGVLGFGGVLSLLLGSMILIDSPAPELQVSLSLILPMVLGMSAILLFLVRLAVASQRRRSVTGPGGMVGEPGTVMTWTAAGGEGRVAAHGEIWTARSPDPLEAGARVRIVAVEGLTLTVRREQTP